jgi:pimeloyl-ACP methyl ester carboxylesterase
MHKLTCYLSRVESSSSTKRTLSGFKVAVPSLLARQQKHHHYIKTSDARKLLTCKSTDISVFNLLDRTGQPVRSQLTVFLQDLLGKFEYTSNSIKRSYCNVVSLLNCYKYHRPSTNVFTDNRLARNFMKLLLFSKNNYSKSLFLDFKHFQPASLPAAAAAAQMSSSSGANRNGNIYEPREISFKTPYGHIACLEWGHKEAPKKILCVHGWLDNAGSFEPLVPYILKHKDNLSKYHVVAMDMPGVGHSSHRPPGSEYTTFSNIIEMRRVTQHLGWHHDLTLLAHSLGGHLSFLYSCIYPKQVSTLISIDTTHPLTHQPANWHVTIGNSIEHYFKCEYYGLKNEKLDTVVPVYTEEAAIKRLMDAHNSSLTLESAKVMFKRGATKHPNGGCTFNRDVRHRHMSVEFRPDDELMLKFLENTFKPNNLLIIRALRSPYHRPEEIRLRYYDLFKRNCKLFRDIMLDGTHHLHMNSPDCVAREINKFLEDAETVSEDINDAGAQMKPLTDKPRL